jgi:hypothetical protein
VLLATLVATSVANAHPVRDFDDLEPLHFKKRPPHIRDKPRKPPKPYRAPTPEELCERNKSWTKLVACLKKQGNNGTVTTMTDLGTARLVSVKSNPSYDNAAVYIYMQKSGRWQRLSGYFTINPSTAVLGFERLKKENGYRLEQGQVYKTTALIGEQARFVGADQTRVPVTLRRKTTSVCLDNGNCQTFITSCEALVDGKARWSFRGTLRVDHGAIRMSGDRTYAGQVCAPSPSFMSDAGDLLE